MTTILFIVFGGTTVLWWLKARCRCPYCGTTYASTAAVWRHIKRSHRT